MDKIQTTIVSVLGLSGALALIVPNAVPVAPQNGATVSEMPSQKSDAADDSDIVEGAEENQAEDDSDWGDEELPTFGEPIGVPNGGDPAAGFDQERVADDQETETESNSNNQRVLSRSEGKGTEKLRAAGLKNGSGGDIDVSEEDLKNARKF